jgi:hypothetical protein
MFSVSSRFQKSQKEFASVRKWRVSFRCLCLQRGDQGPEFDCLGKVRQDRTKRFPCRFNMKFLMHLAAELYLFVQCLYRYHVAAAKPTHECARELQTTYKLCLYDTHRHQRRRCAWGADKSISAKQARTESQSNGIRRLGQRRRP